MQFYHPHPPPPTSLPFPLSFPLLLCVGPGWNLYLALGRVTRHPIQYTRTMSLPPDHLPRFLLTICDSAVFLLSCDLAFHLPRLSSQAKKGLWFFRSSLSLSSRPLFFPFSFYFLLSISFFGYRPIGIRKEKLTSLLMSLFSHTIT